MQGPTYLPADQRAETLPTDALDLVRDAVYQCSHPGGVIHAWNAAAESLYGWSREEAVGRVAADLLASQFPHARGAMDSHLEQVGNWQGEVVQHARDGRPLPVDSRRCLQNAKLDGSASVLIVETDLREQRAAADMRARVSREQHARQVAEELARRLEHLNALSSALTAARTPSQVAHALIHRGLRALGAAAGGVMLLQERDGRLENFVTVGYPPDQLAAWQSMPLSANLPHAEAARYSQAMWFGLRSMLTLTYPHLEPVLDRLGCQALAALPLLVDGHLMGVLHVTFDEERVFGPDERRLSQAVADLLAASLERARAFEDVDVACREAVRALHQRDELLLAATHDLRAPLTGIRIAGQLLKHRLSNSGEASISSSSLSALSEIDSAVGRMSALIDEVLSLTRTRVDPSFLRLNTRPTDLVAIARRVVGSVCPDNSDPRVVLEADSPALLGPWDEFKLERVIANLIDNALKYSPPESKVDVRVRLVSDEDRDCAVVEVADRGVGIPAEELAHVFDRFQRASNVADSVPGTGLGLASVRHIVEQHGGTVNVTSLEGQGATFTVRLPLST